MNQAEVAQFIADPLKKKIDEKIAALRNVEDNFPGVVIIHNICDLTVVYMSQWGRDWLGVDMDELHLMGTEYHNRFFNPEDNKDYVPKIIGLLERNNDGEIISFFQQVRQSPQHDWTWYAGCMKIILRDDCGKPVLTQTTAIPIDAEHNVAGKIQRLLDENNFLRSNYHVFDQLTKREKQILKMMALGDSSAEMAKKLHIAETTASTHRRNIKRKLNIEINYDITRFAQAFDLI
jgi:DNA-binding CsgD family transcriptional regulator